MSAPFGPKGQRAARIERAEGDDSRRVSVAVSSEEPIERWFGSEVLDHRAEAIDLGFFGSGRAPLLLDHDPTRVIGVVESVTLGADRVLRAIVRFSTSQAASEVLTDIRDGIRCNVSVGYNINEHEKLPDGSGYRITSWEPQEVSIVSIPADKTVGVGRSASMKNKPLLVDEADENAPADPAELRAVCDKRGIPADVRNRWIGDRISSAEARSRITAMLGDGVPLAAPAIHTGEAPAFSLQRALSFAASGRELNGVEGELSQEMRRQYPAFARSANSVLIPPDALVTRSVLTTTAAPALVGVEHVGSLFAQALKPNIIAMMLGATFLHRTADAAIPRWTTGTASEWIDEDAAPADSAPAGDTIALAWHGLATTIRASRRQMYQSDPSFEWTARQDMLREIAVAVDRAVLAGTGTLGQPKGILNDTAVPTIALGTNGAVLTWANIPQFFTAVEDANAGGDRLAFATNARVKAKLMTTPRESGQPRYILDDAGSGDVEKLAGYNIAFGGNMPKTLTKGTGSNLSAMIFGNWRELLIAQFGPLDIIVDDTTESAKGNVRITVHSAWDCVVRQPKAFVKCVDIIA